MPTIGADKYSPLREGYSEEFLKKFEALPEMSDPVEYIKAFRASARYKEAFNAFFADKEFAPDVTEGEKVPAFEEQFAAKRALLDFSKEDVAFVYSTEHYPDEVIQTIDKYLRVVRDMQKKHGDCVSMDKIRARFHNMTGEALVDAGLVPTRKLGKTLVSIIAISKGLETYSTAFISDARRLRYVVGGGDEV